MVTKEEKKRISKLLKAHGVKGQRDVWDLINQGASSVEVEAYVKTLIEQAESQRLPQIDLLDQARGYKVFGRSLIARNALDDMAAIMRLPFVLGGAMMPDGHRVAKNHVPVGGVVLTDAIVPGFVGSDIACSVLLTITSQTVDETWLEQAVPSMKYVLTKYAYFGQEMNPDPIVFKQPFYQQPVEMETDPGKDVFEMVKKIARNDFGTSGDGNHFVEFGTANVQQLAGSFQNVGKKRYLAVLSHFGSRAVGRTIAEAFHSEAQHLVTLPVGMTDAPLNPATPLGRDYWKLMSWAGDFAEQGHRWLHGHLLHHLGDRVALSYARSHAIYSQHNFAWFTDQGYIHRKGATPAEYSMYGIVPTSMGDPTQVVMGLGNDDSMNSASHGAGRRYSRGTAIQQFGKSDTAAFLLENYGIQLIGGGPDEDPRAYKPIHEVMAAQQDCVAVIGQFEPVVVRMASPRFLWR